MKVLVTGGAGFIGSYVVDLLIEKGETVYSVDDLSGGYWRNVNSKCKFNKLNLVNKRKTKDYIEKVRPEIIYHLAADATEGRSQFTPISCTERNYLTFLNTIVPAIKTGLKKFVFVSSMSVYGKQKPPFFEEMKPRP
ncbi:UDP-glucose 4-epimerase, partial [Candidatus Shapirobacteria bacterium CG_4_8_14_3_um_filter_39_11]